MAKKVFGSKSAIFFAQSLGKDSRKTERKQIIKTLSYREMLILDEGMCVPAIPVQFKLRRLLHTDVSLSLYQTLNPSICIRVARIF